MTEAYAITVPPPPAGILAGPAPSLAMGGQPHPAAVPFSQPLLAAQQRSPALLMQQQADATAAALANGVTGGGLVPSAKSDTEDTDVEDEEGGSGRNPSAYKCKPRRKATQKPVGSDQKRQAFSKRKRGIVLKAYQLYKLTDAKVFMFMVNDKGSSWAYASPSFGSSLRPDHLKHMRELADLPHTPKHITEVMAHPKLDDSDRVADNRHMYLTSLSVQDNLHLVTGSVPASVPFLQPPPMAPIQGAPRASYSCPTQLPDGMLLHVGHPQMHPQHATLQPAHHLPAEHYMHHAQHPQHLYGQPQQAAPQYMHMHLPPQPQQHLFQPQPQPQLAQYGCPVPPPVVAPAPAPAPASAPAPAPAPAPVASPGGGSNAAAAAAPLPHGGGPERAGSEHSQQPSSSFGQKSVQAEKPASPQKASDGADPKPQAQAGKTGSDEVAIITAGSANLGTFKQEGETEAGHAKRASASGQAGQRTLQQKPAEQPQQPEQPQQQQQQQQQPQQQAQQQAQLPQQQQQPQHAQQLTSQYAGRIISDPNGALYRVVNDQLLPLMPHEVDQALAAAGLQSPGLATLAAAAAVAGGPGGAPTAAGAPSPSTIGMGAVPATASLGPASQPPVHAHHLNGGSLYGGTPEGFGAPQPQYAQLLLPQQLGVGYSQPMFMDGAGGSQAMGGMGMYVSQPMASSYPMHTQPQPLGVPPYPGNAIFYGGPPLLSSTPLQQGVPAP